MSNKQKYHFGQVYYSKSFNKQFTDPWYQPYTKWPRVDLKIYKLPDYYSFDVQTVKKEISNILEQFSTTHDQNADYSGLSLTARTGNKDPLDDWHIKRMADDSINPKGDRIMYRNKMLPETVEKRYDFETRAMTPLIKKISEKFVSPISKISIVKLDANGAIVPHVDFPYYNGIRLHASIFTNENMWYDVEDERFQIPEDGQFYFLNAGLHHGVINEGSTSRINLNINLALDHTILAEYGLQYMIDNCLL